VILTKKKVKKGHPGISRGTAVVPFTSPELGLTYPRSGQTQAGAGQGPTIYLNIVWA